MKKKLLLLLILPFLAPTQSKCITLTDEQIDMIKLGGKIAGGTLAVGAVGYVIYKWLTKKPVVTEEAKKTVSLVPARELENPRSGLGDAQIMHLCSFLDSLPALDGYILPSGFLNVNSWNRNFAKIKNALDNINFAYYSGPNSGLADKNVVTWIQEIATFVAKLKKVDDDQENYYDVVTNLSFATGLIKNLKTLLVD